MKKVALVEDNADNRLLVQAILSDMYEIVEYETGLDALEGLKSWIPDIILLDVSLPEMDGTQVVKKIRENPAMKDVPVIALTAHAMSGDREKYLLCGFNEYVTKPIVDEKVLIDTMEKFLKAR